MPLTVGQVLNNRYRIDALLGQGGMGAVYRAHDFQRNASCAVKEMIPPAGLTPHEVDQFRLQFRQEAAVLAYLAHPSLPRVTDCFSWGSGEILVMDYVEGQGLDTLLLGLAGRGLAESQMLVWAGQLLDALAYCHRAGVIHRDVKPANIIITPQGRAVLVDFGLVKLWNPANPRTLTVLRAIGTPAYAPPEQYLTATGHTDARSDLYSLGATLYHALTGREPPQANLRTADPRSFTPPRRLSPAVSRRVDSAVVRAMALDKAQRFQSAAEMAAALGAGGSAPPPAASRSRIRRVLLVALPALLLAAAGLWLAFRPNSHPAPVVTRVATSAALRSAAPPGLAAGSIVASPTPAGATATPLPPTSTPLPSAAPAPSATRVRLAASAPKPATATPRPPQATPTSACPAWFSMPEPGKGVLLIENHIGEPLHVEQILGGREQWDMPAKHDDVPGRLLLQLTPGDYDFMDYTPYGGRGHVKVRIQAGDLWVAPIWFNDRFDEYVYPLAPPPGCE